MENTTQPDQQVIALADVGDLSATIEPEFIIVDPALLPPSPPTADEIVAALEAEVQRYMDKFAQDRGYDNMISAISYRDDPTVPRWQQEGQAFFAWRSQVWLKCLDIKNRAIAGEIQVPTTEELIAMLPTITGLPI